MRLTLCFLFAVFGACPHTTSFGQTLDVATPVRDFEVVAPRLETAFASKGDPAVRDEQLMQLEGWGQRFDLTLEDNDRLLERVSSTRQKSIKARGDRFLRGTVAGKPESWARINRIDGRYSGAFFDGTELYLLDSAGGFSLPAGKAAGVSETILVRYSDLGLGGIFDHGGLTAGPPAKVPTQNYRDFVGDLKRSVQASGMTLLSMPVTIVADTSFVTRHGANAESVTLGRVNFVDGIYANQLGVGIALWHYEELASNGPLTSKEPSTLLGEQFRQFMAWGDGSDIPFAGLAHLFTGRDLNGSTVGYAYINVLCSRGFGYGINQNLNSDTTSSLVFAHELGHNYSANHVDEGIMRPSVGGSQEFSAESVEVMSDALSRASCLVAGEARIFMDNFE